MERLSAWVRENYGRCRLATSAQAGTYIEAPMLLVGEPAYESFDFMHVDAFGKLKLSAFSAAGIELQRNESIVATIQRLRQRANVEMV
jgi:hypothetical protein